MKTKLLISALGVALLAGSGVALADRGHGREPIRGPEHRAWDNDRWDRADRHWHEYHRHYEPHWNGYWTPAPVWQDPRPYHYPGYYAPPYYDDGVTIILRGRLN